MKPELGSQVWAPVAPSEPNMVLYLTPTMGGLPREGVRVWGSRGLFRLTLCDVIDVSSYLSVLNSNCPKGFRCCDNGCCLEKSLWDPSSDPLR